jgi:hypothetical protein
MGCDELRLAAAAESDEGLRTAQQHGIEYVPHCLPLPRLWQLHAVLTILRMVKVCVEI